MANIRPLWCYAHGREGAWQAICVDLDIAVFGSSLEEVQSLLNEAVGTYIEDISRETPEDAHRLIFRRAPLLIRLNFALIFLRHIVFRRSGREYQAGFDIPCHA